MRWPNSRTWSPMRLPVSPDSVDRRRTSVATTAKPRPLGPARAASMAAFSDSRLVWRAILATSSAMPPRLADSPASSRTDCITSSRDWTKPWKFWIRLRSCDSQASSTWARLSRPLAVTGRPEAPLRSGSMIASSCSRIWAKPDSSCSVASRICDWAVPRWVVQVRAASSSRAPSASAAEFGVGASRRPPRPRITALASAATKPSAVLPFRLGEGIVDAFMGGVGDRGLRGVPARRGSAASLQGVSTGFFVTEYS